MGTTDGEGAQPDATNAAADERPTEVVPTRPAADEPADFRTFLIADIRGYTSYTDERGDEAAAALANRFAGLVRTAAKAVSTCRLQPDSGRPSPPARGRWSSSAVTRR